MGHVIDLLSLFLSVFWVSSNSSLKRQTNMLGSLIGIVMLCCTMHKFEPYMTVISLKCLKCSEMFLALLMLVRPVYHKNSRGSHPV